MTNSSLSFALKGAAAALFAAILTGCGPNDGSKEYAEAVTAYGMHDLKTARRQFERALLFSPTNVDALVYLCRTQLDLGEIPAAHETVRKAVALAGGDEDVVQLLAHVAWHEKDYATAWQTFASLATNTQTTARIRSQGYSGRGIIEMTKGENVAARLSFLRALREDRRNAAAWYHLGRLYRDVDEFGYTAAAMEQFEFFLSLADKNDERVRTVREKVIPELRERLAAEGDAICDASKRNIALCSKTILEAEELSKKRKLTSARAKYEAALKADPRSYPAAMGLAKLWPRLDAGRNGKLQALNYYRLACKLRPSSVSTHLVAAELAADLGKHLEAAPIFSRALAIDPGNTRALDGLVRALTKNGLRKEAQLYQAYRELIRPVRR